jgi:sugar transferase (PEP-CTERM/EpsH1 system associated)
MSAIMTVNKDAVPPLIAHVVHRFDTGGLENGMVNLLNNLPEDRYGHAVVCLDGYTDYAQRVRRPDVRFFALGKKPGKDLGIYRRLRRVLRELRPAIVHTRNLSALEGQFVAASAGVPGRIHGEHGRDVFDLRGENVKYNLLRAAAKPLVHRYIAVSRDLAQWLHTTVGVPPARIAQIYNGVDTGRFVPRTDGARRFGPEGFAGPSHFVIGTVGRMAEVKDHASLIEAFRLLLERRPALKEKLRLAVIGDGPTHGHCRQLVADNGLAELAWLPGERDDIPELMRGFDVFVLPSLGEGISNTILEAMACGLPVVATRVGGNPELVDSGVTGLLVPPGAPEALAETLGALVADRKQFFRAYGAAGRRKVEKSFSIEAMVRTYLEVYDRVALERGVSPRNLSDPTTIGRADVPAAGGAAPPPAGQESEAIRQAEPPGSDVAIPSPPYAATGAPVAGSADAPPGVPEECIEADPRADPDYRRDSRRVRTGFRSGR